MSKTTLLIRASLRGVQRGHCIGSCRFEEHVLISFLRGQIMQTRTYICLELMLSLTFQLWGHCILSKNGHRHAFRHTCPIPGPSYLDLLLTTCPSLCLMVDEWKLCVGRAEYRLLVAVTTCVYPRMHPVQHRYGIGKE